MYLIKTFSILSVLSSLTYPSTFIAPDNPDISYYGRFDFSDPKKPAFNWPGVYIQTTFEGKFCEAILEGRNCYDIFIDGKHTAKLTVGMEPDTFLLAESLTDRNHKLLIVKRSESNEIISCFHGLILDKNKNLVKSPAPSTRKIEFIGDSYIAGFGNEYLDRNCRPEMVDSVILNATNTNVAFGPLTARAFGAQYQVNALSGKGLVRNYNGIDKGKELLYYYEKILISSMDKSPSFDFSLWKPQVIVISIGINDFQADPPYADSTIFDSTYLKFLDRLRALHPGVKFVLCATKVWPTDALIPRIKNIVKSQKAEGYTDLTYFEFATPNTALYGHPSIHDHAEIAKKLIPVIGEVTGWRRVDRMRGK